MDVTVFYLDERGQIVSQTGHSLDHLNQLRGLRPIMRADSEQTINFVTGENNKSIELSASLQLDNTKLTPVAIDLEEIQHSDPMRIVVAKCLRAFNSLNEPTKAGADADVTEGDWLVAPPPSPTFKATLVEDTCVNFKALNGMPGPYIKWFLKAIGNQGLNDILAKYEDKSADVVCLYGLMFEPNKVIVCRGSCKGRIVPPRGQSWGWDPIFEEETTRKTFAELDPAIKRSLSHRAEAIKVLKAVLTQADIQLEILQSMQPIE